MDWHHIQNITKFDDGRRSIDSMLLFLYHIEIYTNKGSTTCQHALKGNVVSFAQDLESVIKLLDTLPLSL
jgi:hypothetical protein